MTRFPPQIKLSMRHSDLEILGTSRYEADDPFAHVFIAPIEGEEMYYIDIAPEMYNDPVEHEHELYSMAELLQVRLMEKELLPDRVKELCESGELNEALKGLLDDSFLLVPEPPEEDGCIMQPHGYFPPPDPFIVENDLALERLFHLGLLARLEIGPTVKLSKPRLQPDEKYPGRVYWPRREEDAGELAEQAAPAEGVIRRYFTPLDVPLVAGYRFGAGSPLSNTTHRVWRRIRFHMELAFRRYLPEELVELMGGKPRD